METGLYAVHTGDRAWRDTYCRQGFVLYILETGLGDTY
jgi:hypothetical protein